MEQPIIAQSFAARCLHQLRLFFVALQFFTRLPIPRWVGFSPDWLPAATKYFPMVGILVGVVTAASFTIFNAIWPQPVAVLLSIAIGIYLTGALHEDGFADTCDGLGGGYTKERMLAIMKDSRIGAYGTIGIVMLLAVKCLALAYLPSQAVIMALLIAHPISRLAATTLIWRLQYVRPEGRAKPFAQRMSTREFSFAAVLACLPLIMIGLLKLLSWHAIAIALFAVAVATAWLAYIFVRRLDGYTGDCLGAVQQASEVACYLGLLAILPA